MNMPKIDQYLMTSLALIATFGILIMFSASYQFSHKIYASHYSIFFRQLMFYAAGLVAFYIIYKISMDFWRNYSFHLLILAYGSLLLVLLVGPEINGSRRWLQLAFINIQVSELSKICLFMYLAKILEKNRDIFENYKKLAIIFLYICVYCGLIFLEPDFSGMMLVVMTIFVVLFLSGMPMRILGTIAGMTLIVVSAIAFTKSHIIKRLLSYSDPLENPFGSGYQSLQSWIAIRNGGWFGEGLGNSTQKLGPLPEAHNDFIFAIFVEEMGIIISMATIIAFLSILVYLLIDTNRKNLFSYYLSSFLLVSFIFNILINVSVALGIVPVTGLSMPLFSYGGSMTLHFFISMALVFKGRQ